MCVYNYEAHRIDLSVSCFFFFLVLFFFWFWNSHTFFIVFSSSVKIKTKASGSSQEYFGVCRKGNARTSANASHVRNGGSLRLTCSRRLSLHGCFNPLAGQWCGWSRTFFLSFPFLSDGFLRCCVSSTKLQINIAFAHLCQFSQFVNASQPFNLLFLLLSLSLFSFFFFCYWHSNSKRKKIKEQENKTVLDSTRAVYNGAVSDVESAEPVSDECLLRGC